MFRLAEQIRCDPGRVIIPIGDHEDFGGAGDHINADFAKDPPLGCRDECIAGPGDLVDRGDRLGPIGQSAAMACAPPMR